MPGLDAVTGGQDVGQVGAHLPVDPQRPPHPGLHAGGHGQVGVGPDPDHDQDQVGGGGEVGFTGHDQAAGSWWMALTVTSLTTWTLVAAELLAEQLAELLVDGGHDRRGLLDQGHGQAAAGEGLGHLQADVATADDHCRAGAGGEGLVEGEGVAHGVQHMHPGQVQAVDRWADRDRSGATMTSCHSRAGGRRRPGR